MDLLGSGASSTPSYVSFSSTFLIPVVLEGCYASLLLQVVINEGVGGIGTLQVSGAVKMEYKPMTFSEATFAIPGLVNGTVPPTTVLYTTEKTGSTDLVGSWMKQFSSTSFWLDLESRSNRSTINVELYDAIEEMGVNTSVWFPYVGSVKLLDVSIDLQSGFVEYVVQSDTHSEIRALLGSPVDSELRPIAAGGANPLSSLLESDEEEDSLNSFCLTVDAISGSRACGLLGALEAMRLVHGSFVRNRSLSSGSASFATIETAVAGLPSFEESAGFSFDIGAIMGSFIYPLIMLLSLPTIVLTFVMEKETKIREMMRLMGLRDCAYVVETFFFKLGLVVLSMTMLYVLGVIMQHRMFTQTAPPVLVLVFFGSALLVVSMSIFLSALLSKSTSFVAAIVGYVVVILSPIIALPLHMALLVAGAYEYKALLLYAPFSISDVVFRMNNDACGAMACLTTKTWVHNVDFVIGISMVYFNAVLYLLLGLYLEVVLPKSWGVSRSPLFCISWMWESCAARRRLRSVVEETDPELLPHPNEDPDVAEERRKCLLMEEGSSSDDEKGETFAVVTKALTKQFGRDQSRNLAVKALSLRIREHECFGLLGPNGAGKTTFIRMLCGLFAQTKGTAEVAGFPLSQMEQLRQNLGLCPQFSIVWDDLTPLEHVLFYARLKGNPCCCGGGEKKQGVLERAKTVLRRVGLWEDEESQGCSFGCCVCSVFRWFFPKEKLTKQLSGGMRRLLSIAISLCGNPLVLCLDEPTTGLDTNVRREVWDVINREKQSRCVLLTTHSMEEADALSDRIGIMSHGRLVCLGSSLHLKDKFGNGYGLSLKRNRSDEDDALFDEFMKSKLSSLVSVRLLKTFNHTSTYELTPRSSGEKFRVSSIFGLLHQHGASVGITDFELNQTSLEDVFLNIIARESALSAEIPRDSSSSIATPVRPQRSSPIETKICEEVVVEEVESDLGEEEEEDYEEESTSDDSSSSEEEDFEEESSEEKDYEEDPTSDDSPSSEEEEEEEVVIDDLLPEDVLVVDDRQELIQGVSTADRIRVALRDGFCQVWGLCLKELLLSYRGWCGSLALLLSPVVVVVAAVLLSLIMSLNISERTYTHPDVEILPLQIPECTSWAGTQCYRYHYTTNGNTHPISQQVMDGLAADHGLISGADFLSFPSESDMLDHILDHANETAIAISFSNKTSFGPSMNVTRYTLFYNTSSKSASQHVVLFKALLDSRIYAESQLLEGHLDVSTETFRPRLQSFPRPPNPTEQNGQQQVMTMVGPLFFSFAALILFLMALFRIVREKELRLRHGLELIGLNSTAYFVSWILVFELFSFLEALVTVIAGYALVVDVFVYSNPLLVFLLVFVFDTSLVILALAVSTLVSTRKVALVIGFIILAFSFIINSFLTSGTMILLVFGLEGSWAWVPYFLEIVYPPFNFGKCFNDIVVASIKEYDIESNSWVTQGGVAGAFSWEEFANPVTTDLYGSEFTMPAPYVSILYLLLNCLIYLVLFVVLECLVWRTGTCQFPRWCRKGVKTVSPDLFPTAIAHHPDEDIRAEYHRSRDPNVQTGLRVIGLKKHYRSMLCGKTTEAVVDVSLTCDRNQCIGVLGHNGAGKSTTINTVAGLLAQNSGEIVIADVLYNRFDLRAIRGSIGVCLQEDVLWETLTAREHLWLYSYLRSPTRNCRGHAELGRTLLSKVLLLDSARARAGTFSGGMKRRLSFALSLVGDPIVVLFDEPTTGLDPFSKNQVWHMIKELQKRSAILFTTHSMEEADALSDKIVILHKGRVRCVGDSLHLKRKFGAGFVLKFVCDTRREEEFRAFVRKAFPHANLVQSNAGNSIYSLKPEFVEELVSGLREVEDLEDGLIEDCGLSQDSLETIYLKATTEENGLNDEEVSMSLRPKTKGTDFEMVEQGEGAVEEEVNEPAPRQPTRPTEEERARRRKCCLIGIGIAVGVVCLLVVLVVLVAVPVILGMVVDPENRPFRRRVVGTGMDVLVGCG